MHITKLIITGASGYLGHRLVPMALARCEVVAAVHRSPVDPGTLRDNAAEHRLHLHHVDLSDPVQVAAMIAQHRPTAIIHAAAANPGQAAMPSHELNVRSARNIAQLTGATGIRLVTVSTDMVLNGRHAPYADDAAADPINEYGRSKAAAEMLTQQLDPRAAIVRTSLIYGLRKMDRGTEGFVARLRRGETLELFHDVIRQPVWIDSLATALCDLALGNTSLAGTINAVGQQALSRAEFAQRMLEYWCKCGDLDDLPPGTNRMSVNLVSGNGVAGLPMDLRLACNRARQAGWALPGVDQVLAQTVWPD